MYVCLHCHATSLGRHLKCRRCGRIDTLEFDSSLTPAEPERPTFVRHGSSEFGRTTSLFEDEELYDHEDDEGEDQEDGFDPDNEAVTLSSMRAFKISRVASHHRGLDYLFKGGPVRGCVYIIGGRAGAGKSTLLLQLIKMTGVESAYYASAEEDGDKIMDRAARIEMDTDVITCWRQKVYSLEQVFDLDVDPDIVVLDSLQEFQVAGVRGNQATTKAVVRRAAAYASEKNAVAFLISRLNSSGGFSGGTDIGYGGDGSLIVHKKAKSPLRRLEIIKHRHGPDRVLPAKLTETGFKFKMPKLRVVEGKRRRAS